MKIVNVLCAVIVRDDKVLACRKGLLEFPRVKMQENESPEDALKREIKEKLCADISVDNYCFRNYEYIYEEEELTVYMTAYICELLSDFELAEHTEYVWIEEKKLFTVNWADIDKKVLIDLSPELAKQKYVITLDLPNCKVGYNCGGWDFNFNDVKDKVEVVWVSETSHIEAEREFSKQIKKQQHEFRDLHIIDKWRKIRLYDQTGQQIRQES